MGGRSQHMQAQHLKQAGESTQKKSSPPGMAAASNSDLLAGLGSAHAMPSSVRAKMEQSFGTDFSGVSLYESPLVAQHGAEAVASGNRVAFSPGKLDFSSARGQALLGHELSHVASQARGEVKGSGVLHNSSLEQRADVEGDKAARGEAIEQLSPMGSGMNGSFGPMQTKKPE